MASEDRRNVELRYIVRTLDAAEGIRAESRGLVRDEEQVDIGDGDTTDSDGISGLTKRQLPVVPYNGVHTDTSAKGDGGGTLAVDES